MADPADAKDYARPRAIAAGLDWPTYEKQIQLESGWRHWRSPGVVLSSPTDSMGLGQLNSKFYRREQWEDPYVNLDTSIGIMDGNRKKFGTYRRALAAYNWGPGNVGGYTKPDGTVVPPWDGRRETTSAQCAHYLDVILGPGWPEPTGAAMPPSTSAIVYEDYRDPEPAGKFPTMPKGIILHGSRSGAAVSPKDKEYLGTARYEVSNPNDLGWHATIGENKVAVHLAPQEWGWHALQASKVYIGVEFAQATVDEPITDAQVVAFVDWVKTRVLLAWPSLPMRFLSHAEADKEQGVSQGKTDAFPLNDPRMDDLRARIMSGLGKGGSVSPQPTYSVGAGILQAMKDRGDQPATHEHFTKAGDQDEWSEAYGTSGRRYMWLPRVSRVFVYEPAA